MTLQKKRWLILLASCLVTLCIGSLYAWSAFASPMAAYLSQCTGKTVTSLAIVFTIANSVGPITMISGGMINDKLGPKLVLLMGGALFGVGMIGAGFVKSVGMLIVTYGLCVGFGVSMIYGVTVSNTVKFFPDKSGFAGGLITACYGGSSIIIPPIANAMIEAYHVTNTFKIIGVVMTVIILASAFVIKACPADYSVPGMKVRQAQVQTVKDYTWTQLWTQPDYYLMLLTVTCGVFAGIMVISQAAQVAQGMMGMTPAAASIVVSVVALFNVGGRLASGTLSDRIGPIGTLRITFAASLVASVVLFFCKEGSLVLFYAGLGVIAFAFGSLMGIFPGFTAQRFGRKNNSANYGMIMIGFSLAGILGPMGMNAIHNMTGRYQPAFLTAAVLSAVGQIFLALLRKKRQA